jgi:hypothetical protein
MGALFLGSDFLWSDLVCYAVGVGIAALLDVVIAGPTRHSAAPAGNR